MLAKLGMATFTVMPTRRPKDAGLLLRICMILKFIPLGSLSKRFEDALIRTVQLLWYIGG